MHRSGVKVAPLVGMRNKTASVEDDAREQEPQARAPFTSPATYRYVPVASTATAFTFLVAAPPVTAAVTATPVAFATLSMKPVRVAEFVSVSPASLVEEPEKEPITNTSVEDTAMPLATSLPEPPSEMTQATSPVDAEVLETHTCIPPRFGAVVRLPIVTLVPVYHPAAKLSVPSVAVATTLIPKSVPAFDSTVFCQARRRG